jgi:DeoR family fructose operon transcriptional repressor
VTLAEDLGVTAETIRRDLTVLERAGVLRRVHGGAIPVERLGFPPALAARNAVMTAEKERIAKAALAALPQEGSVIIDAGTTTGRLAQVLPTDRELTVVVNAPPLAIALASRPNLTVIMLGGRVRGRTLATVDDLALRPLERLFAERRSVLLADHTKFSNDYMARFADLGDVDVIYTDSGLDRRVAAELKAAGPEVVLA